MGLIMPAWLTVCALPVQMQHQAYKQQGVYYKGSVPAGPGVPLCVDGTPMTSDMVGGAGATKIVLDSYHGGAQYLAHGSPATASPIADAAMATAAGGMVPADTMYVMQPNAPGAVAAPGGGVEQTITLTMTLMASQMTAVTNHIYSIQTMSGAEVSSQAVAPGLFYLTLTGSQMQVESAKNLVGAVLSQVNLLM